ncbi:MAG: crossover junction endodeoxyribonuclease RuvC [Xanthomonadaceae bacterium]|nr:crossover junction endodeoxyribonuclease RuvC [Rhodospirillaceae bacterium]NIA18059.1 crossover junction endodeoxyribonuclease RuvC [Xanthomonadaceae bacterium]
MTILGIDPGFAIVGYGIIKKDKNSNISIVNYGAINTSAKDIFPDRLAQIHKELKSIIRKYKPNIVAIEELFFYKNVKTAMEVGQARGVIILTVIQSKIQIFEYTPLQIKQAVSSYGRADKNQVQEMVKKILNLKKIPEPDDAADALAAAICCGNFNNLLN